MTAALANNLPTLLDMVRLRAPDGDIAKIVEVMQTQNPLLQDMVWQEANGKMGHAVSARTGLPSVGWKKFNEGVAPSKSKYDQFNESIGMLEGLAKCDIDLAQMAPGGPGAYRLKESMGFMQALNKEMETAFFYHSTKSAPEKINGLSPRLDTISGNPYSNQIIQSSVTGSGNDQTSVWVVGWGPNSVYGIYPEGSTGGIQHEDLGKILTKDGGGVNELLMYVDNWKWKAGLAVEDARQLVRVANIDTTNLAKTGHALIDDLTMAVEGMYSLEGVRPVIYCNRKIRTYLRLQITDSTRNSTLSMENIAGKMVLHFDGIPVRRTDALTNTEATIA